MKKEHDVAAPTSADEENCASGLIGSVLSLIISILVWLQEVRCKNLGSKRNCTDSCDLASALEKLTQFAKQTDNIGYNATNPAECICPTHRNPLPIKDIYNSKDVDRNKDDMEKNYGRKDKNNRNKKNSKSLIREEQYSNQPPPKPENHPVYYAIDQTDPDCVRCCKKFVAPAPKPENTNGNNANNKVLFEVVAAEMAENETQTLVVELRDSFVQTDIPDVTERGIAAIVSCSCTSVQPSHASIASRHHPETADKAIQVEDVEKVDTIQVRAMNEYESGPETEDEDCVCEVFADSSSPGPISPTDDEDDDDMVSSKESKSRSKKLRRSPRASKRAMQLESDFDGYETETTDYTEESEEEYRRSNSRKCLPSSRSKQGQQSSPRESSYTRSPARQAPIRQERPPMYPTYEPAMYSSAYPPVYHDPYTSQRYAYPPQPYYQKITRTIHRGSPQGIRTAEYDVVPQGRPRSRLGTDCTVDCKGLQEKYSQYEPIQPSPKSMQPKTSGNVYTIERELPVSDKTYTTTPRKLNSPKSTPPTTPKSSSPTTPVSNIPPQPVVIKECDVRCSFVKTSDIQKPAYIPPPPQLPPPQPIVYPNEEKKQPPPKKCAARCSKRGQENKSENVKKSPGPTVAYMPKQAIPISPQDVQSLEVVQAPTKKAVVADSFMSVEPSKKKK